MGAYLVGNRMSGRMTQASFLRGSAFLALLGWAACARPVPQAHAPAPTSTTQQTMDTLFSSLTGAYVASLDEDRFGSRRMRPSIQKDLDTLGENADRLLTHGEEMNPSVEFLSRSLSADAHDAARLFRAGETDSARLVIQQVTENCFACHTRLPAGSAVDLGERLLGSPGVRDLPPHERVRLEVVARRFEQSLETYESILRSPAGEPQEIHFMGVLEEYLKVCVRVRNDFRRAATTLGDFLGRPDLPAHLAAYVREWIDDLNRLDGALNGADELARARALAGEAMLKQDHFGGRKGLVCSLVASALLTRVVQAPPDRPASELAEAYYLLGVTEADISRLSWVSELEGYLEKAIRIAPESDVAHSAYLFLEEYLEMTFSGSSGVRMPADVRALLEELRHLIGEP